MARRARAYCRAGMFPSAPFHDLPDHDGQRAHYSAHTLSEDLAWTHGSQQVQIGAVMRRISKRVHQHGQFVSTGSTNVSWNRHGSDIIPADLVSGHLGLRSQSYAATLGDWFLQVTAKYNSLWTAVVPIRRAGKPHHTITRNMSGTRRTPGAYRVPSPYGGSAAFADAANLRSQRQQTTQRRRWASGSTPGEPGGSRKATNGRRQDQFHLSGDRPGGKDLYSNHSRISLRRFALAYSPQGRTGFPNSWFWRASRNFDSVLDGDDL